MKKLLTSYLAFFVLTTVVFAQQPLLEVITPSLKFGKPSNKELSMTSYAPDTTAAAIVLCKTSSVDYEMASNEFQLVYYYEIKIKVLKSEGTSYANISIPYYNDDQNPNSRENVSQIDAFAYNMEDGKMVQTKMKNDLIFKERINNKYMQLKFSIPAVKVGTVFEYRYKLTSGFYHQIASWVAQQDIPVLYAKHDIIIPEYFRFNLDVRGMEKIEKKENNESLDFSLQLANGQKQRISCKSRHLTFIARQLPVLRGDDYVWCANDYRSQVNFELQGLAFPGALYKSFTTTWEKIDEMLLKDDNFGGMLKMRNPYREEMTALKLNELPDMQAKIGAIFSFLKKKITWNDQYNLYGFDVKKAIKNGTGTNAEINFILMSMLRDANIPSYPVVMSRRNTGILPYAYPSIMKINTFVVAISDTDSTFTYLDGSVTDGYLDVLPPVLMVNRARLVTPSQGEKWVDLSALGLNRIHTAVTASVAADGTISGSRTTDYAGQRAAEYRKRYRAAKDSADFISNLQSKEGIQISNFKITSLNDFSPQAREAFEFKRRTTVNGNLIYLNPMIFLHSGKNPFTQQERRLPLETAYPDQLMLTVTLTLPEGYAVEEIPKTLMIKADDGGAICRYNITQRESVVSLVYTFSFKKMLYLPNEYPGLKSFWEAVVEKNNEMLVLKKI